VEAGESLRWQMKDAKQSHYDMAGAVLDIVVSATCACFRVRTSSGETNRLRSDLVAVFRPPGFRREPS
jgi:hypothetical protein